MADNNEFPPVVQFVTDAIERFRTDMNAAMDKHATKAELTLLEYKIEVQTERNNQIEQRLQDKLTADEAERVADELERKARNRRVWGFLWGVVALVITTFGASLIGLIGHIH